MMRNGIILGGRFYELVDTADANECCGCAFCERCNVSETTGELPCYLMQRLNPSLAAIRHHFEEVFEITRKEREEVEDVQIE